MSLYCDLKLQWQPKWQPLCAHSQRGSQLSITLSRSHTSYVSHPEVRSNLSYIFQDEVFHVRQAQHYCQGHFEIWDPKITTPPGLYFLSVILSPVLGCSISALRFLNALCLLGLVVVLRATFTIRRKRNHERGFVSNILACHSSLNIVLFPPLFFFSALYYTDMASTLSVVLFYWYFLHSLAENPSLGRDFTKVLLGILSLTFRQTNIFWVAVAPAILTLVVELDQGHRVVKESMYRRAEGFGDSTLSVAKTSWKMEVVYDPPIRDAFFEGKGFVKDMSESETHFL